MNQARSTSATVTLEAPARDTADPARVRVVKPVGGRDGWQAIESEEAPRSSAPTTTVEGDDTLSRWLRAYIDNALEPSDRILLVLDHFEGLNFREIGAVIAEPEATVEARLAELNRTLRAAFRAFQQGRSSSL